MACFRFRLSCGILNEDAPGSGAFFAVRGENAGVGAFSLYFTAIA
jgi:hypothetical protein